MAEEIRTPFITAVLARQPGTGPEPLPPLSDYWLAPHDEDAGQ
jgi:hypothetical protein